MRIPIERLPLERKTWRTIGSVAGFLYLAALILYPSVVMPVTALVAGFLFFIYGVKYYTSTALVLLATSGSGSNGNGDGNGNGNGNGYALNGLGNGLGMTNGGTNGGGKASVLKLAGSLLGWGSNGGNGNGNGKGRKGNGHNGNGNGNGNGYRFKPEEQPFISIQLPMYNESRVVDRLLQACTQLDYQNYEVLVADDSQDKTLHRLEKWAKHPKVRVSHRINRTGFKGAALKHAMEIMDPRTQYVAIFDADFIPPPDILHQFLAHYYGVNGNGNGNGHNGPGHDDAGHDLSGSDDKAANGQNGEELYLLDESVAVVQGYQWHVLNASENWITKGIRTEFSGSYVVERPSQELTGGMKMISGSVFMIRADLLRSVGWGTSITEDWELTLRLYLLGYRVLYSPFIQAPAECVSDFKQLARQRMRWAEGHTFNVKKYFFPILLSDKLTRREKLEFVYYAPYYLQSITFIVGTLAWFTSELILQVKLPFWTAALGWSLTFTNIFSLILMNTAGLFLERGLKKNWIGLFSFILLTFLLVPYQAYAALRGLLEPHEGDWHRTQKTGVVTEFVDKTGLGKRMRRLLPEKRRKPIDLGKRLDPSVARIHLALPEPLQNLLSDRRLTGLLSSGLATVLVILAIRSAGVQLASAPPSVVTFLLLLPVIPYLMSIIWRRRRLALNLITLFAVLSSQLVFVSQSVPEWHKTLILEGTFTTGSAEAFTGTASGRAGSQSDYGDARTEHEGSSEDGKPAAPAASAEPDMASAESAGLGSTLEGYIAINSDKSSYLPNETAFISAAVLRSDGQTVCNAKLLLEITRPDGVRHYMAVEGDLSHPRELQMVGAIEKSGECSGNNVTSVPDYAAVYGQLDSIGTYRIKLTATTQDGSFSVSDHFDVREWVPFDIQRSGPVRTYPLGTYEMRIKVTAYQDFEGVVLEPLPGEFEVLETQIDAQMRGATGQGDTNADLPKGGFVPAGETRAQLPETFARWDVSLRKGQTVELSYTFDPPGKTPAVFLLGPVEFYRVTSVPAAEGLDLDACRADRGVCQPAFQESGTWQIASDATFGNTTAGGQKSGVTAPVDGAQKSVTKFTLSEAGDVTEMQVYTGSGGGSADFEGWAIIYDDDGTGGEPGTLLAVSTTSQTITGKAWYVWTDISASLTAGDYWLGMYYEDPVSGSAKDDRMYVVTTGFTQVMSEENDKNGPADPFGTLDNQITDSEKNAYAVYTPSGGGPINLSGTVYSDEGGSALGANETVDLRINGTGTYTDETDASGIWQINSLTVASGDIITVYLDDETEEGTTVMVSNNTTQTNLDIYQNRLILRADTGSITNANLNTGDDGDDDVKYNVGVGDALTVDSGFELHIWNGDSYDPNGAVDTQGTSNLHVDSNATAYLDTATNDIAGDLDVETGATLNIDADTNVAGGDILTTGTGALNTTAGTPTVTVTGAGTLGGGTGTLTIYNLTLDSTGTTTLSSPLTTNNNLTVGDGVSSHTLDVETNDPIVDVNGALTISASATLTASSTASFTVQGNWTNDGTFNEGTGTVTLDGTTSGNLDSGCADADTCTGENFYNLTLNKTNAADANDNVTLTSTHLRVTNTITITDGELVQGAWNVRVEGGAAVSIAATGAWTNISTGNLTLGGSFANAGAVTLQGNGATCGDADSILIRSTAAVQRSWTGVGTFAINDVDVSYQAGTASITAQDSTDSGNNGANWTFDVCLVGSPPNTPTQDSPVDGAVGITTTPTLKTTTTDPDSDDLRYKIEIATDTAFTQNLQTFDQTVSQTGWSGQDADGGTAYASGTQAVYTIQTALSEDTTYYWRSYAKDYNGSDTWSGTQNPTFSFDTGPDYFLRTAALHDGREMTRGVDGPTTADLVISATGFYIWYSSVIYPTGNDDATIAAGAYDFTMDYLRNGGGGSDITFTAQIGLCDPVIDCTTTFVQYGESASFTTQGGGGNKTDTINICPADCAAQTIDSDNTRRLVLRMNVTAVTNSGIILKYDGPAGTFGDSRLATPTVVVPEYALALAPFVILVPLLVGAWKRKRKIDAAGERGIRAAYGRDGSKDRWALIRRFLRSQGKGE